jgi:hypothetical protein
MYQLGGLHAKRQIAVADPVEGYMWLRLAQITGEAQGECAGFGAIVGQSPRSVIT